MTRSNIFDGDSYYALFARVIYKQLMSRQWITYADIMACHLGFSSSKELSYNVSNYDKYGELRKAFRDVYHAIINEVGEGSIEEQGNNRNKSFRYVGENENPLAAMINARVVKDLKKYWEFCQDSAGFFPEAWLEYYFADCQDLLSIKVKKKKGEQVISSSIEKHQTNIEYLPMLYEFIKNHQVLSIDYKPYEEEKVTIIFHPHYLKEYNGRWHLFGYAEEPEPKEGVDLALDRITNRPREVYKREFVKAPDRFYESFFKNRVGVGHHENSSPHVIHIRAHSLYVYKLMETKKLHESQETVLPFEEHDDGCYGEFTVYVEVNNEFIGRILQMGDGLEIVSPPNVRDLFRKRVEKMAELYK